MVPQICPGCGVKHREFFCLAFVGGLRGLDKLVKEVLGLLGQKSVKRCVLLRIVDRLLTSS
jgi:hypothetical protein